MADRVHPRDLPLPTETTPLAFSKPSPVHSEKPVPSPGTYVIQIPKDQVYRVPPPENTSRYQSYTCRKPRRSCCRCCCCWFIGLLAAIILLSAAAAGVFYLVVRPESPNYSVESIAFKGFNLTMTSSPPSALSPEIQVTVWAQNPNKKIGIYYERESSVKLFYSDIKLCDGVLPAFCQPSKNVTKFRMALTGSGIKLTTAVRKGLVDAQKQGKVPLELDLRAPIRIKVGPIKTWTINVKVACHITVDKLTADANIVSRDCDYGVDPW